MRLRFILPLLLLWPRFAIGQTQSASLKDDKPSTPDAKPCVSPDTAREVLRLGRSLGYPDDQIVEAYGQDPCEALSYLRQEAQQKAQSEAPKESAPAVQSPAPATAPTNGKPRVTIRVVETKTGERDYTYTTPGTPGKSKTNCDTIGTDTYSTTDCTTTHTPGTPPVTQTNSITQENVRAIMADGTHVMLWCQTGFRTCDNLAAGDYSAEVNGNTVWVSVYDLSHKEHRVKYKAVGGW